MNSVPSDTLKLPVNNMSIVITATAIRQAYRYDSRVNGVVPIQNMAERYVIARIPTIEKLPFAVYKEKLRWNSETSMWDHAAFMDGMYRSSYGGAMKNFMFRTIGIVDNERSN